jgi:hypothetical protein
LIAGWGKSVDRVGQSKDLVAALEDMRSGAKERMAKARKAKGVQRDTPPAETSDVRARMTLEAMKDESPI